jgi:hypothetical protein
MKAISGALVLWLASAPGGAAPASIVRVQAGGDLQAAIEKAKPGDVIELEPGATYVGHFTLMKKDGDVFTTIRTAGAARVPAGGRVSPADATTFAKLVTPDNQPALQTAQGAHHWRVELLEVTGADNGDLIDLGDGGRDQRELSQVPHDLVLDRLFVHGDPVTGRWRGIGLNSASTTITGSHISDIKTAGRDVQAIGGWNGPGPFTIANNYLEGSTENVMFGGSDPAIQGLVPSDITITHNTIAKPERWKQERWQVKNLLELKNARHVVISDNVLEYNWAAAQTGFAILFTVRNQDGGCPWCEVSDVVFENNLVRHSGAAVQILGSDYTHPSQPSHSIVIRSNIFADIDSQKWGGGGYAFSMTDGPKDLTIDHNTIVQEHGAGFLQVEGPPVHGFVFTNNIVRQNTYGIAGRDHAPGNDSLSTYFPGARFTGNVIADGDSSRYPPGNRFPSFQQLCAQMASCQSYDYQLRAGSEWRDAGASLQPVKQ